MAPRLPAPFSVSWDELTLDDLLRFFELREDESLTWEAKGGGVVPADVREAASAFGNSELGGILVLGASQHRETRAWTADHWQPREAEVALWVEHCLRGVSPMPSHDVKAWDLDGGGRLACLAFWPASVPPVMTPADQVWERTSGESRKVTDPIALRRLFERGQAAEDRIYRLSNSAAHELLIAGINGKGHAAVLGFGAASVPSEVSGRIFRESFYRSAAERVMELHQSLFGGGGLRPFVEARPESNQGGFTVWTHVGFAHDDTYQIRVGRHGSVAVGYASGRLDSGAEWAGYTTGQLARMWFAAHAVLESLNAIGTIHVSLYASDREKRALSADQWSDMESTGADEMGRLQRDIRRGLGDFEWEPEET